ncbi:PIG-L family deacetylase [Sansalvadorimonas sp. 2012CJ34-2]|uniref:PIG-L family deacetylase n=1 Tax=Parendozoicomonas callyspongiae TaxID=2942213 RepID=A0ABT0PMR9_9GAMM|nr:PIG-L deacetylase family protein [Sansalvadorimonas sp. 2012CJ34-2]MCL6272032.1 PIG-L family deacetylase [Sansalvadorimonas sp. 2012CJ34-2]
MKVLVVAPHPDDETLGCGGTILKHLELGDDVTWLVFSRMSPDNYSAQSINKRNIELEKVKEIYSGIKLIKLDFNTTELDRYTDGEVVGAFSKVLNKERSEHIYLPYYNDVHTDHHKVFTACSTAIKNFRYGFVKKIFMYETLSETNFLNKPQIGSFYPNSYSNITAYLDLKIRVMKVYESEIQDHPFPRSEEAIKALALLRGSECGVEYAESFMILKETW